MRQLALAAMKLAVSGMLLYFAVTRIDFSTISDRLYRLEPCWILFAIVAVLLQIVLSADRWRRIALACGVALARPRAIRLVLIAAFFNQVLPSSVGGDAAKIWLLAYTDGSWWKATCSVLLDRFVGMLVLAALVTVSLYWSFSLITDPLGRIALAVIGFGSLVGGAAFLACGSWSPLTRWNLTRRFAELANLARTLLISGKSGSVLVISSVIIHILTATIAWSLARAAAADIEFGHVFLLVLPVILIATIPISIAGWGVRESALMLAFSYAGLPEGEGLIVSVLYGAVMFLVGIIGGVVWLATPGSQGVFTAWKPSPPPQSP